jgi:hypothetical protein
MSKTPLLFLHVTKTAGGSIKELVRNAPVKVRMHYPSEEGWRRDFKYPLEHDVYFGHFMYGVHKSLGVNARYAAFIREPVARTVSHYNHLKNNETGPIGKKARAAGDLLTYIYTIRSWEMDNFMCRTFSGIGNMVPFGEVGWNVYRLALENINNNFVFVGVFERLQASLSKLAEIIPIDASALPEVNIGQYEKEIDANTKELLESLTSFDRMLYDKVLASFD